MRPGTAKTLEASIATALCGQLDEASARKRHETVRADIVGGIAVPAKVIVPTPSRGLLARAMALPELPT
jgi:hypothetical protein